MFSTGIRRVQWLLFLPLPELTYVEHRAGIGPPRALGNRRPASLEDVDLGHEEVVVLVGVDVAVVVEGVHEHEAALDLLGGGGRGAREDLLTN